MPVWLWLEWQKLRHQQQRVRVQPLYERRDLQGYDQRLRLHLSDGFHGSVSVCLLRRETFVWTVKSVEVIYCLLWPQDQTARQTSTNAPPTPAWTRGPASTTSPGTSATVSCRTPVWCYCWSYLIIHQSVTMLFWNFLTEGGSFHPLVYFKLFAKEEKYAGDEIIVKFSHKTSSDLKDAKLWIPLWVTLLPKQIWEMF